MAENQQPLFRPGEDPRERARNVSPEEQLAAIRHREAVLEKKDREKYAWDKEHLQQKLNQESVKRWTEHLRNGKVSKETFLDEVLPKIGVERDEDGSLLLYHTTTAQGLEQILEYKEVRPADETGNRAWSVPGDEAIRGQKVYLTKKDSTIGIAAQVQKKTASPGAYILKVKAKVDNLRPDEDNQLYKDDEWAISLAVGAQSCSHLGSIQNFEVVGRLPFQLPDTVRQDFFNRARLATNDQERNAIQQEFQRMQQEMYEQEKERFSRQQLEIEAIPIVTKDSMQQM